MPILMYHSVSEKGDDSLCVSQDSFNRQMAYIKWKGYNVISLDELVEGIKNKKAFKRDTIVITFDDGYKDNYKYAHPILKKCGFSATIFVASNAIGKEKERLNWQEMIEMAQNSKISFGAHTRNHSYLPEVKGEAELRNEILGSKEDIEKNIGKGADYFCYPTGGFTEEVKTIVKESGYKGACTTNRGFARNNQDIYELKRIKIKNSDFVDNPLSFWIKLSGYYNILRKGKKPY
ncbi:MAG: polysaccharide deacetylase family protein [Candidatus Omnitrophota bacterium]